MLASSLQSFILCRYLPSIVMCKPSSVKAVQEEEDAAQDPKEEQKEKVSPFVANNIRFSDFVNPSKPWILIPNGSFGGHFDWVPAKLRTGPWHIASCLYLAFLCYWIYLNCLDAFVTRPPAPQAFEIHATNTWQHWYNVAAFGWTFYIAYRVATSEFGWGAFTSYTLQSWCLIIARHGLAALAPYYAPATTLCEYLRFPMLLQASITFIIWNFVLFPVVLAACRTPKARKGFVRFCFGFLMTNLHILNLVFAAVGGIWGTPARALTKVDFAVGLLFTLQYILFYLFILDRLGLHYYMVFSPRSSLTLVTWTLLLGCLYGGYSLWSNILPRYVQ